jgi:hypothetical protein
MQLVDSAHPWSMPPSRRYCVPMPTSFFIVFWCLFNVHYIWTFPRFVNNWHHIILFVVHVHLPLSLGPIGFSNQPFDFYFRIWHQIFFR